MSFNFDEDVDIGDIVLYQSHPGAGAWYSAIVAHKSDDSLEVVVYAWNGAQVTGSHKSGVRHVDHELWGDPMRLAAIVDDGDSGCFELHPKTVLLKDALARLDALEDGRKIVKKTKPKIEQVAPKSDLSFRLDDENAPPLTPEQLAEKKRILQESA
jgi:hypothetical protein